MAPLLLVTQKPHCITMSLMSSCSSCVMMLLIHYKCLILYIFVATISSAWGLIKRYGVFATYVIIANKLFSKVLLCKTKNYQTTMVCYFSLFMNQYSYSTLNEQFMFSKDGGQFKVNEYVCTDEEYILYISGFYALWYHTTLKAMGQCCVTI